MGSSNIPYYRQFNCRCPCHIGVLFNDGTTFKLDTCTGCVSILCSNVDK